MSILLSDSFKQFSISQSQSDSRLEGFRRDVCREEASPRINIRQTDHGVHKGLLEVKNNRTTVDRELCSS
jgi:hypothetical protein